MKDHGKLPHRISKRSEWAAKMAWSLACSVNGSMCLSGKGVSEATKQELTKTLERKLLALPYSV